MSSGPEPANTAPYLAQPPARGTVALITGGARRVGRSVALYLARGGYDVAFTYHSSEEDARSLEAELRAIGRRSLAIRADLRALSATSIATRLLQEFGRLDLLMHNASIFPKAGLAETTPELISELMQVHVTAPLELTKALEGLLRSNRGSIIAMTDIAAERPYKSYLAYCASKAALQNLALGLAKSLAPEIRVNAIAPGAVEFPEDMPAEAREKYLLKVPLGRVGTPEDVARAVWFLAEEAPYMTGQVLRLDGGRSLS